MFLLFEHFANKQDSSVKTSEKKKRTMQLWLMGFVITFIAPLMVYYRREA